MSAHGGGTMNRGMIGFVLGSLMTCVGALAIVLLIGKLPALRSQVKEIYVAGAVLAWIVGFLGRAGGGIGLFGGYVATLLAIWGYRRSTKAPPSGWARIHAVLNILWLVLAGVIFTYVAGGQDGARNSDAVFGGVGIAYWIVVWVSRWIIAGFRKRNP